MITLITGSPGAGKSAYIVAELLKRQNEGGGPAFVSGIPELKLPHEPLPPVQQWTHRVREEGTGVVRAEYSFPPNSVLVVDEAQGVFRPRSSSAAVPDHVAALETHRHTGVDLWLVTQHPGLLDANVKRLVGRHIHLHVTWMGRYLLEWSEAVSPGDRGTRATATRVRYRLPKKVFGLYKSATEHVKVKRRVPWQVAVFVVTLLGVAFGIYRAYSSVRHRMQGGGGQTPVAGAPGRTADTKFAGQPAAPALVGVAVEEFKPRLVARPETAPLYDQLRKPVVMPILAGCMVHGDECSCYTQQATRVDVTEGVCRAWLKRPPFNPYKQPDGQQVAQGQAVQPSGSSQRAATGVGWSGPVSGIPQRWTPPEATTANKLGGVGAKPPR